MQWLNGKRVSLTLLGSNDVNSSESKGVITSLDSIGFQLEQDNGIKVSFVWAALSNYKIIELTKSV